MFFCYTLINVSKHAFVKLVNIVYIKARTIIKNYLILAALRSHCSPSTKQSRLSDLEMQCCYKKVCVLFN